MNGHVGTSGATSATPDPLTASGLALRLPLAGVGLLLAIDPILDMIRTATNVAGQALVPTVVAAREGVLDRAAYDSAGRRDLTEPLPAGELLPTP